MKLCTLAMGTTTIADTDAATDADTNTRTDTYTEINKNTNTALAKAIQWPRAGGVNLVAI